MNIQHVIYAMEVYDYHSFTEAAKSLYISQPRLSQAIRELEDELGFEIFIRNKRGISGATVKGYEFLEQARILLRQFSALESLKERNLLSFHLSTTLLSQAQDAFIRLTGEQLGDPCLNLDLWFSGCYETAQRVRSVESDLGVVTIIDDQFDEWLYYFKSNNIEYHDLCHSPAYVTVSRNSALAAKESIRTEDLQDYTYIAEKCSRMNDLTVKVYAIIDRICPESRITVSNTDMMYTIAGQNPNGRAFVFEPFPPSAKTQEKYKLVSMPFEDAFSAHVGYISLAEHKLSSIAARYVELLRDELSVK